MDPYIGKMLDDRYEILERIGTGGMAVVYKAKCHRLNRLVAVKILKSDLAQDADFRRRFHAESKAVAMLSHPNIVSVYDVSQSGETEYIVMELIDGITLKQYMERRGQLNWRESLHFITQIMKGLSHAHSRGIVHRDIKPQNIMVLRDGSVKVADFGIACLENSAQTLTQEALGSVHYISPEQARGDRTDARSDIYSAGVVFYEMLTGRLPFEGDSAVSVAIQHLSSIPLPPREINPDIPPQLELICLKAMAPDIEKRYQSAEAMISDLETFRKNPEVDLDYSIADLQDMDVDEPTRHIPTASHHRSTPSREPARRHPEPEYEEEEHRISKKTGVIIAGGIVAAAVLIFLLFHFIFGSFQNPSNEELVVPNVLGMTIEDAENMEEVKGVFTIKQAGTEFSSDYEAGQIIRQSPEGDTTTKTQTTIEVWISAGDVSSEMIDMTNMDSRLARDWLEDLDLDLNIRDGEEYQEYSDDYEEGRVIRTDPVKGTILKKGDTVTLYVSKGKEEKPVTLITFRGNIDDVSKTLDEMGLSMGHVTEETSDEPAGTILSQSPAAGTEVPAGTKIDFVVSKGPDTSTPTEGTDIVTVALPNDGRTTVKVTLKMNGSTIWEKTVNCSDGSCSAELRGSGSGTVDIYIDDAYVESRQVNFDNG